jgi:hypothetical protein
MAFITPGQVSNIPRKPLTIPTDWVRPTDWPTIIDDTDKIQMLVSDIGTASTGSAAYTLTTTFTRTGSTYSVYIDWGDGSPVDKITTTSTTYTNHNYTSGGATCSRGYKTWVITITTDPTVSLSSCNLTAPQNIGGISFAGSSNIGPQYLSSGLLELYHGDNISLGLEFNNRYGSTNGVTGTYTNLEYVKLPSVSNTQYFAYTFFGCSKLQRVIMPITMNSCLQATQMFANCVSLKTITMMTNATSLTTMNNMFQQCASLYEIIFPGDLNSVTSATNLFLSCGSLDNITLPSMNSCIDLSSAFAQCSSLTNVKITSVSSASGTTVVFTSTFSGCQSLVRADLPRTSTLATWSMNSTFNLCNVLPIFVFPSTLSFSTLASTFANCISLTRVDLPTTLNGTFLMTGCFNGCYNLTSITLPTSGSPVITSFNTTFQQCTNLLSMTIPSNWSFTGTDMGAMFSNCFSIKSVSFLQASISATTLQNCFVNCWNITSITLPTALPSVTTMAACFNNCYSLTSMTLPSSMPALTILGNAFDGCRSLVSVVLPTSAPSLAGINFTFRNCWSIKSITLPPLTTNLTTMNTSFQSTYSLSSVNFTAPSSFGTALDITNIFNISSISSVSNLSLIGTSSLVNGNLIGFQAPFLGTYSFSCRFSKLGINGSAVQPNAGVKSLRLPASALTGQWGGTSPQIDISFTAIDYTNLLLLFNDIAAQGNITGKTINITSCAGASSLTAGDRLIITSKGWTITG